VFIILALGWLWRHLVWVRFLWLMSRLDLQLMPSHPDQVGGLNFISTSLRGYRLLCCSLGAVPPGVTANLVVREGAQPRITKNAVILSVAIAMILVVSPLTIFIKKLRKAKKRGVFEYGALAGDFGLQFERKWLNRPNGVESDALEAPDFSAANDLYSVASKAY